MEVLDQIDRRGSPGAAKRALAYLRKFFNWCAERDIIATPPTDRVPPPHPEVKRDRVLNDDELRYLLRALDADTSKFAAVVRLLLMTGQRRGEVAGMRWSELRDISGEDALWEIPAERTKNKHTHFVPIVAGTKQTIEGQPRVGDLLFTATGTSPVSGFGKAKKRLDALISRMRTNDGKGPSRQWRLHDLRRTMVTVMNEELGIAPHIVEAVVNHISGSSKAGVAGVYNRALYLVDRRRALAQWASYLGRLLNE
jgi:integrase